MTITSEVFKKYAKKASWLDVEIVNIKVNKGWSFERICSWLIKQINNEDGFDFTYEEAFELKELLQASNNYRI
jgi:hypothetical protein